MFLSPICSASSWIFLALSLFLPCSEVGTQRAASALFYPLVLLGCPKTALCKDNKKDKNKQKEHFPKSELNIVEHCTQYSGAMYLTLSTIVLNIEYNFMKTFSICLFPGFSACYCCN